MRKRFAALKMLVVANMALGAGCVQAGAVQSPTFGIYAYDPTTWNSDVAHRFPIVVVQYHSWQPNTRDIANIKHLAASGSRVIIDFEFWKTPRERRGDNSPPIAQVMSDATAMLDQLKGVPIEAISLEEENLPTPQRLSMLNELYSMIKQRYPDRRLVQWISANVNLMQLKRLDLHSMGADGWIIDPYVLPPGDYANYVRVMQSISSRIYSVVWAAPGWQFGGALHHVAGPDWWNGSQWRTFYNRLAVNRQSGIPTIFFMYGLNGGHPRSLWKNDACGSDFYNTLITKTLPYIRQHELPEEAPGNRPSWLPGYCGRSQGH